MSELALDTKGISIDEVKFRYPKTFQTLGYDVALDTDSSYKPKILSSFEMCINSILTLLFMKPGQYPSIPELGIDIESYLHEYADDTSVPGEIQEKLMDQCNRLNLIGIQVQVYFDTTEENQGALIVEITGTERIAYGSESHKAIIGITHDKLNRLYIKKYYM